MNRRNAVTSSFRRWTRSQDAAEVLTASSVGPWLVLTTFVVGLLAVAAWAPGARLFFGIPFGIGLLCATPMLVTGLLFSVVHRRRQRIEPWGWLWLAFGVAAMHFFVAALMALSALPGATVIASLLLFTTAFHGRLHRVTPRQPFLAVGTALALLAALQLRDSDEHLALFGVIGPAALTAELYLGSFAMQHDKARSDAERLRAAVHAQLLEQQERDVGRLSQALGEILGYHHDLDNALQNASSAADMLAVMGVQRHPAARAEFDERVKQLRVSLAQIKERVTEIRAKGRRHAGSDPEPVELTPVLESVQASVGLRFPDVDIHVEVEDQPPPRVLMRGGAPTLRRVVENLVLNACEGDGENGAEQVRIRARVEPLSGRLEVVISDDGPGFTASHPAGPSQELFTTKPQGTGLGLYTSECLLRASGGMLHRQNAPGGGALLRVVLPREYR
ncbi:HAMP domain-containing histidine kinase [Pyxidicoccus fallax]|uniref:histidine kinase n=1 Tax=Pyxidicoccus fallax TaxID=394095 RepID=A0A848L9U6_9BACT|nr:HAMP domain-containing sensor histidine kinase [Pyxidicoccus fallax]NMO15296.1 HAMP domain-containing histidine kinase [Pyxidicoccus fallax]NPC78426.1 HAMP domain-containing histidine kinase [Pyxidicoccus fallax]